MPEDEFFFEFIEPRRLNKELSPFIYQLLRAYYEDQSVKDAVAPHLTTQGESRIDFINRELSRIAMEHSQTILETQALQDEIEERKAEILDKVDNLNNTDVEESLFDDEKVVREKAAREKMLLLESKNQEVSKENTSMDNRIKAVEDNVSKLQDTMQSIASQFSTLMNIVQNGGLNTSVNSVNNTNVKGGTEVNTEIGVTEVPTLEKPAVEPVIEDAADEHKDVVIKLPVEDTRSENNIAKDTDTVENTNNSQELEVKSAAFGALLGSMKKS